MLKYAIIGFGGLGKFHCRNLLEIQAGRTDISLVAICNSDISSITKSVSINTRDISLENIDFSNYSLYTDYKEMIEKETLDFVFITLPTYLHCEATVYCLEHGINVFVEKPMALTLQECATMMDTAEKHNKKLMVGHCLRFSDAYTYLKNIIQSGKYGKAVKAEFLRKSPLPTWSFENWLLDESKSGGCIVDMAAHDIDLVTWLFGEPAIVHSVSSHNMSEYESVYAICSCDNVSILVNVDWGLPNSYKFKSTYDVTFEKAHVQYSDNKITIYTGSGIETIELEKGNHHMKEAVEFIEAVADDKPFVTADVSSVYESMKLLFSMKRTN